MKVLPAYKGIDDRDDLELCALIQQGIDTPRADLSPEEIEDAIRKLDPTEPLFMPLRGGARMPKPPCPNCGMWRQVGVLSPDRDERGARFTWYLCRPCNERFKRWHDQDLVTGEWPGNQRMHGECRNATKGRKEVSNV